VAGGRTHAYSGSRMAGMGSTAQQLQLSVWDYLSRSEARIVRALRTILVCSLGLLKFSFAPPIILIYLERFRAFDGE